MVCMENIALAAKQRWNVRSRIMEAYVKKVENDPPSDK